MIALLTGGSGCGKSTLAERLIGHMPAGNRFYIATMQVYDDESRRRVARHQAQRAHLGFATIERETDLAGADLPTGCTVLLEDLPNLLANEMFSGGDPDRICDSLTALAGKCANLIMVTNDVFSDGVQYPPFTDEYLRRLAHINTHAAAMADQVIEVVYSIPLYVKGAP